MMHKVNILVLMAIMVMGTEAFANSARQRSRGRPAARASRMPPQLQSIERRLTADPRSEVGVSLSNIRCTLGNSANIRCTVVVQTRQGQRTDVADPEIVAPFLRPRIPFSSIRERSDFPVKIQVVGRGEASEVVKVLDTRNQLLAERIPRVNMRGPWQGGVLMGVDCTLGILRAKNGHCHLLMRMTADRRRTRVPDTTYLIQPAVAASFSLPRQPRRIFDPTNLRIVSIPAANNRREIILVRTSTGGFISQKINYLR